MECCPSAVAEWQKMAALEALQQDAQQALRALGIGQTEGDDGDASSKTTITVKSLPPQHKKSVVSLGLKHGLVLKVSPCLVEVAPLYYFSG